LDERQLTRLIVDKVIEHLQQSQSCKLEEDSGMIPIGVSIRHVHLSQDDVFTLFGGGYQLNLRNELQPGQFAAEETVTLVGPRGILTKVRVLGPVRKVTQVEVSQTDAFALGINPPVRDSGQLKGSAGIVIVGPAGCLKLEEGVIRAARHIHFDLENAKKFNVKDGDRVSVRIDGERALVFANVLARVDKSFRLEMHLDTDEANAAGVKSGDTAELIIADREGLQ